MSEHTIEVDRLTWERLQELVEATHMSVEEVLLVAVESAHSVKDQLAVAIADLEAGWAESEAKIAKLHIFNDRCPDGEGKHDIDVRNGAGACNHCRFFFGFDEATHRIECGFPLKMARPRNLQEMRELLGQVKELRGDGS